MTLELTSDAGLEARFAPFGARLISLTIPDKGGKPVDVVAGHETGDAFKTGDRSANAVVGRFANRIKDARFTLDGATYQLIANERQNQLHGGPEGFHRRDWEVEQKKDMIVFSTMSQDGDQGYPGELSVRASFAFSGATLVLVLEARTTKPTVINLTQHGYWNLAGSDTIADHLLQIAANGRTPVDKELIPDGTIAKLDGTPYDFREPRPVSQALGLPIGLDDNFCLTGHRHELHFAAAIEAAGRRMEVHTTEPGLQVYTANHHGPQLIGKHGRPMKRFDSIALEPQTYPNAPNTPSFPSAVLRPGDTYRHRIEWRFSSVG